MGNGPKAWILLRAFSSRADPSPPRRGRQGCFCQNNRLVCRSERILTRYSSDDLSTGNLCSPFLQKSEGRQSVGREESPFLKNITAARAPFPVHPGGRGGRSPARLPARRPPSPHPGPPRPGGGTATARRLPASRSWSGRTAAGSALLASGRKRRGPSRRVCGEKKALAYGRGFGGGGVGDRAPFPGSRQRHAITAPHQV